MESNCQDRLKSTAVKPLLEAAQPPVLLEAQVAPLHLASLCRVEPVAQCKICTMPNSQQPRLETESKLGMVTEAARKL